jgi:hypothetical protein
MLAKSVSFDEAILPDSEGRLPLFEPKWDGVSPDAIEHGSRAVSLPGVEVPVCVRRPGLAPSPPDARETRPTPRTDGSFGFPSSVSTRTHSSCVKES